MPRMVKRPVPRAGDGLDVERELERLYTMLMEDIERIREHERETGELVVNKYLYYDQANRVLGQIILLRYKYSVTEEDPWRELASLIAGEEKGDGAPKARDGGAAQ